MSKPSIVPFILVVTLPIGLFITGIAVIVILSMVVWDSVQTESFMSRMSAPLGQSFSNIRQAKIKSQAVQLVAILNSMDPGPNEPPREAKETLRRLILVSGEDFGTGFRGDAKKYTWKEPMTGEEWATIMQRVNTWSDITFGTDFGSAPMPYNPQNPGDGPEEEYRFPEEPPPTYETPEEREQPSYTPPPNYEPPPPPPPVDRDTGGEISPDYNERDGFQPEPD